MSNRDDTARLLAWAGIGLSVGNGIVLILVALVLFGQINRLHGTSEAARTPKDQSRLEVLP